MKKPNLSSIDTLFLTGKDFSITESQYLKETNATLPKDFYYLKKNSAIAKLAKKRGFKIVIKKKTIMFEKE
jgi:hypothetical protein